MALTLTLADHFLPYVNHLVSFVGFVCSDNTRSYGVTRGALGVIGDLAQALGPKVKQQLQQPFVNALIAECLKSEIQQTQDVAKWTKEVCDPL
jgi:hypothetical protein